MGRPPIQLPRVTFRFPESLKEQLADSAAKNGRSMNEEVVARLEWSFITPKSPDPDKQWVVDLIHQEIGKLSGRIGADESDPDA